MPTEGLDIKKFFGSFFEVVPWMKDIRTICSICIIAFVGFTLWRAYIRRDASSNVHKPSLVALPFSKIDKVDQTSTQVMFNEKEWELGLGAGALTYDNKSGGFVGGWIKKKF